MTSASHAEHLERSDVATIVGGGFKLGLLNTAGVVAFALVSRPLEGMAEMLIQSALILAGMLIFAYWPTVMVQARSLDGVGWAALIALLAALVFTVLDAAVLRPMNLYHWTWDRVGGGSGFWYIPVWWMGSSLIASLGGVVAWRSGKGQAVNHVALAGRSTAVGLVVFAAITIFGILPATSATFALGVALGMFLDALVVTFTARD